MKLKLLTLVQRQHTHVTHETKQIILYQQQKEIIETTEG
jgi:hypothetical protein